MTNKQSTRRTFLRNSFQCAAGLAFLHQLPHVSYADAAAVNQYVQFEDELEPLVTLIEETPRSQVLEQVAQRIKAGTTYQQVLAALLCAGVRSVQPRPSVGFKFHAVLVVNSCHLASLHGPEEDRWLPIFWGIDNFKSSQADEARRSGWKMSAVDESKVPHADTAADLFIDAMNRWDVEQADVATAGIVRALPPERVFELFAQFAARDYRSIGHKAIFLANAWRTLQVIGWKNAEPILRSLSFALLNHEGDPNPANSDLFADRPWRTNESLAKELNDGWKSGKLDDGLTHLLIGTLHQLDSKDATLIAIDGMQSGIDPQSVWDGVFLGAGELLMRQPGIVGLHALTTTNAMHYLFQNVTDDQLRRRLLLQACSFIPMFRESSAGRGKLSQNTYELWKDKTGSSVTNIDQLTDEISRNKMQASLDVRSYLQNGGSAQDFIDAARRQIFLHGTNAHDYKYSSAVLEDFTAVSPKFRNDFLALSVFNLRGSKERDNGLNDRTRAALS